MRNRRLIAASMALAAILGGALSACSGTNSPSTALHDETGSGKAIRGGALTVGTAGELVSFDPAKNSGFGTLVHPLLAVYDTLLRLDGKGRVKPNIAESVTSSKDLKTWTMRLRPGVKFSDGTALDAKAVKANIERHQDPAVQSQSALLVSGITKTKVVDPTTIEFDLASPDVAFPIIFTLQPGLIASPKTLVPGYPLDSKPIGAGPFVLKAWQRDAHMQLTRNREYFQKGLPYLDSLEFRPVTDTTTRLSSLRSGDIQLSSFIDQPSVEAAKKSGLVTEASYGNGGDAIFLNTRRKPLDDIRIRRALAESIDPKALNAVLFAGKMNPANGPFTPDSPYYVDDNGYPALDEADARSLVKDYKSEYGDDAVKLELAVNNVPDRLQLAQLVQAMWNKVGFDVTIAPVEAAAMSSRFAELDFETAVRNVPNFTDPEPLLSRWFASDSPLNYSGIKVPALDKAFEKGKGTSDTATRVAAYREVSQELASALPVLWYAHGVRAYVHAPNVTLGPDNVNDVLWYQEIAFKG